MRVLFFGDMAATGFGTVTMDLGKALLDKGVDVRFYSQNDVDELPEPFDSRTISTASLVLAQTQSLAEMDFPAVEAAAENIPRVITGEASDVYVMSGHAWGEWRPDACVLLGDFAAARLMFVRFVEQFKQVPTYHYVPIEGVDLPPSWKDVWNIMRPIAISEFGADQIESVMGVRPPVAYHGIDTEAFHPATPEDPYIVKDTDKEGAWHRIDSQDKAKKFFGVDPRIKMILRTDTHWPRKQQNAGIRSLAPLLLSRRDTIYALHVSPVGPGGNLLDTLSKFPELEKFVQFTGLGKVPRDILAILYNAADVYFSCSAEGFGLTIAEAIACGTPAVGLQYSAVPEVIGPAGMVVEPAGLMENEYDHFWAYPDEDEMRKPVDWLLSHPKRAREIGALGPRHVREHFTWERAADVFLEVLGETGTKSAD